MIDDNKVCLNNINFPPIANRYRNFPSVAITSEVTNRTLKKVRDRVSFRDRVRVRLDWTRSNQNLTSSTARERLKPGHNLSGAVDDVKFWLLRVASRPV